MLKSITIPGSVTKIAERAFDSTGLTSVTVPKNAIIDSEVFPYDCKITKKINSFSARINTAAHVRQTGKKLPACQNVGGILSVRRSPKKKQNFM